MAKRIKGLSRNEIIASFPKLSTDVDFEITSPSTPFYNCIAWAYNLTNRWMWPKIDGCEFLDGHCYWPEGVIDATCLDAFKDAFKLKGYEVCDDSEYEEGYRKIALYVKDGECTHAARQLVGTFKNEGKWSSKLGQGNDIQHGTPYTIEGDLYGNVACIMKQKFP